MKQLTVIRLWEWAYYSVWIVFWLLMLHTFGSHVVAQAPPVGSPLANKDHPRLFFTATDLAVIRARLAFGGAWETEIQDFITLLDDSSGCNCDNTSGGVAASLGTKATWSAFNYAFMGALDPAVLTGYTYATPLDTRAEYCARAYLELADVLPFISIGEDHRHGAMTRGYPYNYYIGALTTYDWCYSELDDTERTTIISAFDDGINANGYYGKTDFELFTHGPGNQGLIDNNQATVDMYETLGALAFFGDPEEVGEVVEVNTYRIFDKVWITRLLFEYNYFYAPAFGHHEGTGGYHRSTTLNNWWVLSMMSSAMGENYFETVNAVRTLPEFYAHNQLPMQRVTDGSPPYTNACDTTADQKCGEYIVPWGSVSDAIDGYGCLGLFISAGKMRDAGNPLASLAKYQHSVQENQAPRGGGDLSCDEIEEFGNTYAKAVIYWFLHGTKDVTAFDADALGVATSYKFGLGQYSFVSDFTKDASRVQMWATVWDMYGHFPRVQAGPFSIYKFGNLVLHPGNTKSGRGVFDSSAGAKDGGCIRNVVGIHQGIGNTDPTLLHDASEPLDPVYALRDNTRLQVQGVLLAEDIGSGTFDYVGFDHSNMQADATSTMNQREFVNIRGADDEEYVVILDRANVVDSVNDQKLWNAWVPVQPVHENGTVNTSQVGRWQSTDSTLVSVTNARGPLVSTNGSERHFPVLHGKMYLTSVLPDDVTISFYGGVGTEFQSCDGDGTEPWGSTTLNDADREILGWGRISIQPDVLVDVDQFLNVMQIGDSATLTAATTVSKVESSDKNVIGAHIEDVGNQWVVTFSKADARTTETTDTDYPFSHVTTISEHLMLNAKPSNDFFVLATGLSPTTIDIAIVSQGGTLVPSTSEGVLRFTVSGTTVTSGGPAATFPPPRLTGLRISP